MKKKKITFILCAFLVFFFIKVQPNLFDRQKNEINNIDRNIFSKTDKQEINSNLKSLINANVVCHCYDLDTSCDLENRCNWVFWEFMRLNENYEIAEAPRFSFDEIVYLEMADSDLYGCFSVFSDNGSSLIRTDVELSYNSEKVEITNMLVKEVDSAPLLNDRVSDDPVAGGICFDIF